MPKCSRCGVEKPVSEFHCDAHAATGRRPNCKSCGKVLNAQQWAKHREKRAVQKQRYREVQGDRIAARHRAYKLERQYGLASEQVEAMFASQNGKCAICSATLVRRRKGGMAIDHCHATGVVRGLLCHRCNTGLGLFRDSPDALRRAAEYISGNAIVPQIAAEVLAAFKETLDAGDVR